MLNTKEMLIAFVNVAVLIKPLLTQGLLKEKHGWLWHLAIDKYFALVKKRALF